MLYGKFFQRQRSFPSHRCARCHGSCHHHAPSILKHLGTQMSARLNAAPSNKPPLNWIILCPSNFWYSRSFLTPTASTSNPRLVANREYVNFRCTLSNSRSFFPICRWNAERVLCTWRKSCYQSDPSKIVLARVRIIRATFIGRRCIGPNFPECPCCCCWCTEEVRVNTTATANALASCLESAQCPSRPPFLARLVLTQFPKCEGPESWLIWKTIILYQEKII